MKTKVRKTYNYLIRILIIAATYGFIYKQLFRQRDLSATYNTFPDLFSSNWFIWMIIVVFLLMLLNWGIEALKWCFLIRKSWWLPLIVIPPLTGLTFLLTNMTFFIGEQGVWILASDAVTTGSSKHWTSSPCGVSNGVGLEVTLDNTRLALGAA